MASVLICSAVLPVSVAPCITNQKIGVSIGDDAAIYLSREESVALAADLLDAVEMHSAAIALRVRMEKAA